MGRDLSTTPPAFHSDPLSLRSQRLRVKFSDSFPQSFPFISHLPYLLPSSVSCNSFVCHSYENCRGVYKQFPFWFIPSAAAGNSSRFLDIQTLRTSLRAISFPFTPLRTLLRFFAFSKNSTRLLSCGSELF